MDNKVTASKPKIGGAVYNAPLGTALPTDTVTELDKAFVSQGYISDEGITNSNSPESNAVKAWGGQTVLNTLTDKPDTFAMTFLDSMDVNVLKTVYGTENVTGTLETGISINVNADEMENRSWVVDMILKGGVAKRIVIPSASIIEVGDIVYVDGEPIGYNVTISATPDAEGNTHYEYLKG